MGSLDSAGHLSRRIMQDVADGDSDEWEYEYDEAETEDVYFTVDLTTHDGEALAALHDRLTGGRTKKVKQTWQNRAPGSSTERASTAGPHGSLPSNDDKNAAETQQGKLQMLDLHSAIPIIKLDDNVYSCNWTTDLGTQVYVSRPGLIETPLRRGHVLDVIALSRCRLVGKPIILRERPRQFTHDVEGETASNAIDVGDDREGSPGAEPTMNDPTSTGVGQQLVIPRAQVKGTYQGAQASFLERLSTIKLKKGELDIVPTKPLMYFPTPANAPASSRRTQTAGYECDAEVPSYAPAPMQSAKRKTSEPMDPIELGDGTPASTAKRRRQGFRVRTRHSASPSPSPTLDGASASNIYARQYPLASVERRNRLRRSSDVEAPLSSEPHLVDYSAGEYAEPSHTLPWQPDTGEKTLADRPSFGFDGVHDVDDETVVERAAQVREGASTL